MGEHVKAALSQSPAATTLKTKFYLKKPHLTKTKSAFNPKHIRLMPRKKKEPIMEETEETETDAAASSTDDSNVLTGIATRLEERIATMLEEHRASIATDFKATFATLESRLDKIQTKITDHGQRMDSLESHTEVQDQRIQALEERCVALVNSNTKLTAKTIDLESRSRRNNIRIIGLPESIEGPRPTSFFADLLAEVLGDQILQSPPELDRAHRALTAKPPPGSRPRPVIIRLHRYQTKEVIIREARKRRGKLQYRGSPIQIFEDYTPEVAEERARYRTVMAELYNLALRPSLLFTARLQITLETGAKKRFSSPEEATSFAAKYQQAPRPD